MMLATYLDVALASMQTVMFEIEDDVDGGERVVEAFMELEVAMERVRRARRLLR